MIALLLEMVLACFADNWMVIIEHFAAAPRAMDARCGALSYRALPALFSLAIRPRQSSMKRAISYSRASPGRRVLSTRAEACHKRAAV